jgi:hypothetical protein
MSRSLKITAALILCIGPALAQAQAPALPPTERPPYGSWRTFEDMSFEKQREQASLKKATELANAALADIATFKQYASRLGPTPNDTHPVIVEISRGLDTARRYMANASDALALYNRTDAAKNAALLTATPYLEIKPTADEARRAARGRAPPSPDAQAQIDDNRAINLVQAELDFYEQVGQRTIGVLAMERQLASDALGRGVVVYNENLAQKNQIAQQIVPLLDAIYKNPGDAGAVILVQSRILDLSRYLDGTRVRQIAAAAAGARTVSFVTANPTKYGVMLDGAQIPPCKLFYDKDTQTYKPQYAPGPADNSGDARPCVPWVEWPELMSQAMQQYLEASKIAEDSYPRSIQALAAAETLIQERSALLTQLQLPSSGAVITMMSKWRASIQMKIAQLPAAMKSAFGPAGVAKVNARAAVVDSNLAIMASYRRKEISQP